MLEFLRLLPEIASQPLAVVAYIVVATGWLTWLHRRRRSVDFLKALEALPESEKGPFARKAGYTYSDLANLTRAQRVRLVMGQWFFLGFLAIVLAVVLIVLAAISANKRAVVAETLLSEKQRESRVIAEKAEELEAARIPTAGK